jgi:hypothetical protein
MKKVTSQGIDWLFNKFKKKTIEYSNSNTLFKKQFLEKEIWIVWVLTVTDGFSNRI